MSLPEDQPGLTAVPDLFTYHIFGTPRDLDRWQSDVDTYWLSITGLVKETRQISVDQARKSYEPVTGDMVLQCMTNVHWGRIRFTGPRLVDVLDDVGLTDGAKKLAIRGADGFATDLCLEEVREEPEAYLLAYEMNGEPIPPDHGYPLRLTADGRYGYKWCKWLSVIEAVDHDFRGHYEGKRRWSDAGKRGTKVTP